MLIRVWLLSSGTSSGTVIHRDRHPTTDIQYPVPSSGTRYQISDDWQSRFRWRQQSSDTGRRYWMTYRITDDGFWNIFRLHKSISEDWNQLLIRNRSALPLDRNARVLVQICPPLRHHHVLLVGHRESSVHVTCLEDGGSVAEDKVDDVVDVTLAVEWPDWVGVKRVLVSHEAAEIECKLVGAIADRHVFLVHADSDEDEIIPTLAAA